MKGIYDDQSKIYVIDDSSLIIGNLFYKGETQ
jgi:hypothetical protein